jgi:uncharacterized phage protein (TIGR02218 family)
MTAYDDADRSRDDGRPAELFQFSGGVQAYYTTSQGPVIFNGLESLPDYVVHGELEQSEELNKQSLEITLRGISPVASLYVAEIPTTGVDVRVYRFLEGIQDFRLVWAGRVVKAVHDSERDECSLQCEPIFTMLRRAGLRRNYQLLCPYALYGDGCLVQMSAFSVADVVTSMDGNWLSGPGIAAKAAGWFVGGILRSGNVFRLINDHSGGRVHVAANIPGLRVGGGVNAIAGCDKSLATCEARFGNSINFGGFPYIPAKNPFTGDSLYS